MLGGETITDIVSYIKKFLLLLIEYYGSNRMKLNDEKTTLLIMKEQFQRKISITATNNSIIYNTAQTKILGVYINSKNDMMSHLRIARSRSLLRAREIAPVLEQIKNIEDRKILVSSLCISIANYCSPLLIGQCDSVKKYHHVTIMKLYRIIYNASCYMTRCEDICKSIKLPMPREAVAQSSTIFLQKIHFTQSPPHLYKLFKYPVRSRLSLRPKINSIPRTERSKRSLIYAGLELLSRIPDNMMSLEPYFFKQSIRTMKDGILTTDERRNW